MQSKPREIRIYECADGTRPFSDWMDTLESQKIYGIVLNRIDRVERGNLGDCHGVGGGISELRIDFGPGYRVYFGQDDDLIILLNGGIKRTQADDIKKAIQFWKDYNA